MKTTHTQRSLFLSLFFALMFIASNVSAQDAAAPAEGQAAMDPKMAELMAKFQAYSTPTENHKVLEAFAGNWDTAVSSWMAPDAPAETSSGTSEAEMIMGGRFMQSKFHGAFMGQAFEGIEIMGYDNLKKEYQTLWIDNMGTGMMIGKATYNAATKTLVDEGHFTCPMVDGDRTYRSVTTFTDNDHYTFEMYMIDPVSGKEYKNMEIRYTRKS